jgi:hypothetical protein
MLYEAYFNLCSQEVHQLKHWKITKFKSLYYLKHYWIHFFRRITIIKLWTDQIMAVVLGTISPSTTETKLIVQTHNTSCNITCVALVVATLIEKPDGAFHSYRSSLDVELTSLTELEVTCKGS